MKTFTLPYFAALNKLELELIQSHMAQKPMLRGEVGARALRVRSDVRGHGQVRLCKALGCGRCGCLKPIVKHDGESSESWKIDKERVE